MKFQNLAGQSVELSLPGFERGPGRKWLVVVGDVNDGTRRWRFEEPCMTRRDASRLADWFDKVADRRTKRHEIDFLEPNLSFEVVRDGGLRVVIRVAFELEARPPWNDRAVSDDEWRSVGLEFDLLPDDLHEAAKDLRAQLTSLDQ